MRWKFATNYQRVITLINEYFQAHPQDVFPGMIVWSRVPIDGTDEPTEVKFSVIPPDATQAHVDEAVRIIRHKTEVAYVFTIREARMMSVSKEEFQGKSLEAVREEYDARMTDVMIIELFSATENWMAANPLHMEGTKCVLDVKPLEQPYRRWGTPTDDFTPPPTTQH